MMTGVNSAASPATPGDLPTDQRPAPERQSKRLSGSVAATSRVFAGGTIEATDNVRPWRFPDCHRLSARLIIAARGDMHGGEDLGEVVRGGPDHRSDRRRL